jgi:hypothetical protein
MRGLIKHDQITTNEQKWDVTWDGFQINDYSILVSVYAFEDETIFGVK